ncbi:MAG: xanthine dehydrogenase family protein molybdopterin-binding subunit [Xanthobacteraceae bacterium]|nr:xanthine dehydrogenase family protein molybdopterin-binding subunit [Xanthobacteraceae bacterium]
MRPLKFGSGQPHTRLEDPPLVMGHGKFVADCVPEDALRAAVLRSPHAHAKFKIASLEAAKAVPGVKLILTADDVKHFANLACRAAAFIKPVDEKAVYIPPYEVLCTEEVRHVGDAIAFVIADTVQAARNALEAIEVEWTPLPAISGTAEALKPGVPQVWPGRDNNKAYIADVGDAEAAKKVFDSAAKIVKIEIVNQRLVTNFMETRGVVVSYGADGRYTMTVSSQGANMIHNSVCGIMKLDPKRLRVLTDDVGGGFGTKAPAYREYVLAALAAEKLKAMVAWIADRSEHFIGDNQGRDHVTVAEMAIDKDGRFLAMRLDCIANMGAYYSEVAPYIPYLGASMMTGVYDIPVVYGRVRTVWTHTVPVDAYRGAGRPEAAYLIERLADAVALATGIAPEEIRRRNFVRKDAMPYKTATGRTYDSGDFNQHLTRALEASGYKSFASRHAGSKKNGKLRGIGIASYIEACGQTAPETSTVRIEKDGTASVLIGTQTNGQGHATTFRQLVHDQLGLPLEKINVITGDTDLIPSGGGTVGSRSMPTGGSAVSKATTKLADNLKALAATHLDAKPEDIEIADGLTRVRGTNRALSFAELAAKPGVSADQLSGVEKNFIPPQPTYPNGTHVCEVEIDPETGRVEFANYVVVDDFGVTLNPLLLEGQVHGGIGQGIGQAIMEDTVYDESGQLLSASLMDYALPRAADTPNYSFETKNVPCTTNPLGVKGAGEAGAIGSCPAVMNAVVDALHRGYGITHIDMPATPQKVWQTIQSAQRG